MPGNEDFLDELRLVPTAGDELSADEQLDLAVANLLSTTPADSAAQSTVAAYGRSWAFDYEAGQFVRHGGAPAITTELETLRGWCEKAIRTTRRANEIYSPRFGTDPVDLIGLQFDNRALTELTTAITDALLVHDRIAAITQVQYRRPGNDDYLLINLTVVTDSNALFSLNAPVVP